LQKMKNIISRMAAFGLAVAVLVSCGPKKKTAPAVAADKAFPVVEIPGIIQEPSERLDYLLSHFWEGFLSMSGLCDTSHVNGVRMLDVEEQFGTYSTLLWMCPLADAVKSVSRLFGEVEDCELRDTSSNVFETFNSLAEKYLYDPNSPVRNEEFYLPYIQGLAKSNASKAEMRPAYGYDASMCALNRIGTPVADFRFKDVSGRIHTLYGVKADYTLLFFVNPGCPNCREIMEQIIGSPWISEMEADGKLAIVCVYIDEEIDKWKEYVHEYPEEWLCGYDPDYIIRTNQTYNIRAIPSLYLLDNDKNVLMKDAPQDKVFERLEQIAQGE